MRRSALILVALIALNGCTFSQDGVGLWWPVETPKEVYQDRRTQLARNAQAAGLEGVREEDTAILVTGSTGPYRQFTESTIEQYYEDYVQQAVKYRVDEKPSYDLERFRREYSGWTSVSPIAIPGLGKQGVVALVPVDLADSIEFSSGVTSVLVGDTDDYVAARTNPDGAFYIFKQLCPDDADYALCTKPYASGYFDQITGQEVDLETGVPRKDGAIIDTKSLVAIKKRKKARSTLE